MDNYTLKKLNSQTYFYLSNLSSGWIRIYQFFFFSVPVISVILNLDIRLCPQFI